MSSRLTVRAKPFDFIFFLTLGSSHIASSACRDRTNAAVAVDEAGQFVAGIKGLVEQMGARIVGQIVGMRADRVDYFLGIARGAQDGRALQRMIGGIGPALVIEIVQEADDAPGFFIGAMFFGVGAHGDFDRLHVAHQAGVLDVFVQ